MNKGTIEKVVDSRIAMLEPERTELVDALYQLVVESQIELLKDLSDVGEIHHSVLDYREEQLQSQLSSIGESK